MAEKLKIGAVSYLNTKPLIYGFEKGALAEKITLTIDYPAKIAEQLIKGGIDAGLVPVAALPHITPHFIISDYCIGCDGEVASVGLFSDVPLPQIETILLDYQSSTSVELLKIIAKEHWKIHPAFAAAGPGFENEIAGTTAGLVIGDRAFAQKKKNAFYYDLGLAWKEMTGLPFVFAAWISNKKLDESFINEFNAANAVGLSEIEEIINQNPSVNVDLHKYYTKNLSYKLDEKKLEAVKLFLGKI